MKLLKPIDIQYQVNCMQQYCEDFKGCVYKIGKNLTKTVDLNKIKQSQNNSSKYLYKLISKYWWAEEI